MSTSDLKEQFQHSLSGAFPTPGFPYAKAAVLVLHWAEDDFQPPCEAEAREIQELFSHKLFYDTVLFRIPSQNSRNALEKAVVDFKFTNDTSSSLMIIYYSGHGDPDIRRGKAVWAAKRQGGPTVDWFEIQPSLENAHADVLLVFDCCHASLATKARYEGKLELLAASSAAGVTPCPGPHSFTRYFKDELEKAVSETGSLQVDELHVRVNRRTMETTRITPVHFNMRSDPPRSITLRPLSQSQNKLSPLGAFTFTVSVSEAPSQHNIRQLGEWMKRTAPSTIFAINVDKVVDLSTSLQGFLLDEDRAGVEGRFIDTLQTMEKATLLAELRKLEYNVADASLSSTFLSTPTTSPLAVTSIETSPNLGTTIFQRFERGVNRLFQSTWSAVSRHPAFQSDTGLERLEHNEAAQRAGISAAASMSILAQNPTPLSVSEAAFIPCDGIVPKRLIKDDDRFSLAMDTEKDRPIILEIIRYSPDEDRPPTKELEDQFAKTSSLLARPKPEYYRILRCIGYTHNKDESWYGLGFEIPKGYALYSTLESQFTKTPRVPLERRYDLAYSIALSIAALHNVHWVHKGIRSENVLFFSKKGDAGARLDQPWLFGFEYTRDNAADSSKDPDYRLHRLIYLPPSRWGKPAEKFTYAHDIYTLGVLLLEIGFWTNALKLNNKGSKNVKSPESAQAMLVSAAGNDLSHMMGSRYSQAVMACLTGKFGNQADQGTAFRKDVLDILGELTN